MLRSLILFASLLTALTLPAFAADLERDFSGNWVLDTGHSRTDGLGEIETLLRISQGEAGISCSAGQAQWSYALDGSETRKRIGEESRSSVTKWEGAALLINTLVSGASDYTIMDRWRLSRDRNTLTITRQITRRRGEAEGALVFVREGVPASATTLQTPSGPSTSASETAAFAPPPELRQRPRPAMPPDVTIPAGTRVLLSPLNELNTKQAREGDRVYLRTSVPVAMDGQVVIPRYSDVQGTITRAKAAGHIKGKGELFIRFESLTLPNGVSRDFRALPVGDEGKVPGNGRSADTRTVAAGTGIGASIGGLARGLPGAAVGAGIGALAGVLLSRDQNLMLPRGAQIEMVLDHDLVFHPDEIPPNVRYR